jgi:prolyl oligopeptidase
MAEFKFFHQTRIFLLLIVISIIPKFASSQYYYPTLNAIPHEDNYFGSKVVDKYRNVEDTASSIIKDWVYKEQIFFDSIMKLVPRKDSIKKQIEDVIYSSNIRGGQSRIVGEKVFFNRNYIKENKQSLFYKPNLNTSEIELFTTKTINTNQTTYSFTFYEPSLDGKYVALGLNINGDEMTTIRIIDVENKVLLPESLPRTPFGTPFWLPDNKGFFYAQLKELKSASDLETKYNDGTVKLHYLFNDESKDKIVMSRLLNKDLNFQEIDSPTICVFPNTNIAFGFVYSGSTDFISLYYTNLNNLMSDKNQKGIWKKVCSESDRIKCFAYLKNEIYLLSFKDNPNGRVKKITLGDNLSAASTVMDGFYEVLEDIHQSTTSIFIKSLKNGNSAIYDLNPNTNRVDTLKMPFNGYVYLRIPFITPPLYSYSTHLLFGMESWVQEFGIYDYDSKSKIIKKTNMRPPGKYGSPSDIIVKDLLIPSHDGILVPLTIIYSNKTKLNGKNPTLIEGYGAYGTSMNANFSFPLLVWIQNGGIYAVAHVRGGGEKGDSWYKGGFKDTKPNSWKDFIACSEHLINEHYTTPQYLAAKGVSAGGITIGRAITERPDLFKAAILNVGVLNSIRNSSNSLSVSEYGNVKDSLDFKPIFNMDVYHHIKENVNYPSILFTAGKNDARVDWWQPAKAVARFQEVSQGKKNIILFNFFNEGHAGTSDPTVVVNEYSFLFWQLNGTTVFK